MLARCTNNGTIHHSQETLSLLRAQIHKATYKQKFLEDDFRDFVSKYVSSYLTYGYKKSTTKHILSNHLHNLETAVLFWILLHQLNERYYFVKRDVIKD